MIKDRYIRYGFLALAFAVVGACHRQERQAPVVAAPPPPPPRNMKMVCRNSDTGQKVPCGTPHAVMVGMRPE